ncbi:btb (poz) domain-containing 2a-related [Anaeramoeba flamelloides]|uniref:Btb (Poz) domain-containing 2a-related n=1 Tax=Anaeramoeba flamelloides TaxID=1746091 RepID=A0ABQ8XFD1_9EUKA|nr:btb (poz) domain-containing 2a-related [Anaeramoeba flamelloides]
MTEQPQLKLLHETVNKKELADVKFVVGKESTEIYAHRLLLSLVSGIWRNEFYPESWDEQERENMMTVRVENIEPEPFLELLQYCYTQEITLKEGNIFQHFSSSLIYQIGSLTDICFAWIEKNPRLLQKKNCLNGIFIDHLIVLIKSGNFGTSEFELYQRVLEYGRWLCQKNEQDLEIENIKELLKGVLPLIKLHLMGSEELRHVDKDGLYNHQEVMEIFVNRSKEVFQVGRSRKKIRKTNPSSVHVLLMFAEKQQSWIPDMVRSISTNKIKFIDCINVGKGEGRVPHLDEVKHYDAVFFISNSALVNQTEIGDLLALYLEFGGGLVVCSINSLVEKYSGSLMGRIIDENFLPMDKFEEKTLNTRGAKKMKKNDSKHYVMQGIKSFSGGRNSFHSRTSKVTEDSNIIAKWDGDSILAAEKRKHEDFGIAVVLNMFPISQKVFVDGFLETGNERQLISNAVAYVALH